MVVVCLGTNDLSTPGYDTEKFTVSYIAFIRKIRSKYPTAKIVLCNSPMLHYETTQPLADAITNTITTMLIETTAEYTVLIFKNKTTRLATALIIIPLPNVKATMQGIFHILFKQVCLEKRSKIIGINKNILYLCTLIQKHKV